MVIAAVERTCFKVPGNYALGILLQRVGERRFFRDAECVWNSIGDQTSFIIKITSGSHYKVRIMRRKPDCTADLLAEDTKIIDVIK